MNFDHFLFFIGLAVLVGSSFAHETHDGAKLEEVPNESADSCTSDIKQSVDFIMRIKNALDQLEKPEDVCSSASKLSEFFSEHPDQTQHLPDNLSLREFLIYLIALRDVLCKETNQRPVLAVKLVGTEQANAKVSAKDKVKEFKRKVLAKLRHIRYRVNVCSVRHMVEHNRDIERMREPQT